MLDKSQVAAGLVTRILAALPLVAASHGQARAEWSGV